MNESTERNSVIELPPQGFSRREEREPALPAVPSAHPMMMLSMAVQRGMDPATIKDLMDLQARWEAAEARKAFNEAFAAFKAEAVQVIRNKVVTDGPLKGKAYAELFAVVDAATPFLSKHGLSASWKVTKDDREWIEVTCILQHVRGHSESVSLGGPPDGGGAKNAIQARASTVTYLERYTFKAVTGLAEKNEDRDGNAPPAGMSQEDYASWKKAIEDTPTEEAAKAKWQEAMTAATEARDVPAAEGFRKILAEHKAFMKKAAK